MGAFTVIPQDTFDDLQLDAGILLKNFDPAQPAVVDADIVFLLVVCLRFRILVKMWTIAPTTLKNLNILIRGNARLGLLLWEQVRI